MGLKIKVENMKMGGQGGGVNLEKVRRLNVTKIHVQKFSKSKKKNTKFFYKKEDWKLREQRIVVETDLGVVPRFRDEYDQNTQYDTKECKN